MVLTGELMDAPEAQRIGLLDWVVPESQELNATVAAPHGTGAQRSAHGPGLVERLVTASFHTSFEEGREMYLSIRRVHPPRQNIARRSMSTLEVQAKRHQEKPTIKRLP